MPVLERARGRQQHARPPLWPCAEPKCTVCRHPRRDRRRARPADHPDGLITEAARSPASAKDQGRV